MSKTYHVEGWVQVTHSVNLLIESGSPDDVYRRVMQKIENGGDTNNSDLKIREVRYSEVSKIDIEPVEVTDETDRQAFKDAIKNIQAECEHDYSLAGKIVQTGNCLRCGASRAFGAGGGAP